VPYRTSAVVPDAKPTRFRVGNARFNTAALVLSFSGILVLFVAGGTGHVRLWMVVLFLVVHVIGMVLKVSPFVASLEISRDMVRLGMLGWRRNIPISQIGTTNIQFKPWGKSQRADDSIAVVRMSLRTGEVVDVPIGRKGWFLRRATAIVERINEAVALVT
jgi:hypothetical protein